MNWGSRSATPIYLNLHNQNTEYFAKVCVGFLESLSKREVSKYSKDLRARVKLHLKHLQLRHLFAEIVPEVNHKEFRLFKTPYGTDRFYIVLDRYIADNAEATTLTGVYSKYCPSCALGGTNLTQPIECWTLRDLDQQDLYHMQDHPEVELGEDLAAFEKVHRGFTNAFQFVPYFNLAIQIGLCKTHIGPLGIGEKTWQGAQASIQYTHAKEKGDDFLCQQFANLLAS
eukprot:TRINITY_DN8835_c0_g1_i3.p1 TRINITY_DN8835_c0_g1~~TRINITY_DN8835_c0_g1_i3.p1  ORF type:complete len:228 (-),score=31.92 TRINITY_DN8835_c0_g1_i3:956-1639(-)